MTARVAVASSVLVWATRRAGLTLEEAERRIPNLLQWLEGGQPTLKQLEDFARKTYTPIGQLFLEQPPIEAVPIPDYRTIQNRELAEPSANLLDTIYVCQERQEWYRRHAIASGYLEVPLVATATVADSPKEVAAQIRGHLSFEAETRHEFASWEEALRTLIDRIEDTGVLVARSGVVGNNNNRKLNPEEFRGFALSDDYAPLIFINGADTKAAQIFTLIHELAHLWLGQTALSDPALTEQPTNQSAAIQRAEYWCNAVAGEVLIPSEHLATEYTDIPDGGTPDSAELDRLAKHYRVSTLAVIKQLYATGQLDWPRYRATYRAEQERITSIAETKRRDGSGGGNYYYTQRLRLSQLFAKTVIISAESGTTSYRDAYRMLGTKKHETFTKLGTELGVI